MIAELVSFRLGLLRPAFIAVLCCIALLATVTIASASDEPRDYTTVMQELNAARHGLNADVATLEEFAEVYAEIDGQAAKIEKREPYYDPASFDRDEPLKTCSYLTRLRRPAKPETVKYWHTVRAGPLSQLFRSLAGLGLLSQTPFMDPRMLDRYEDTNLQHLAYSISGLQKDIDRLTGELEQLKQADASPEAVGGPNDPVAYPPLIKDGIRHYKNGDYGEAHRLFDQAANEGVEVGMAHYGRGSVQAVWGYHDRAFADFDVALAYMPEDVRVHCSRGLLFQEIDRDAEAIADFKAACDQRHELTCSFLRGQAIERESLGLKVYEDGNLDESEAHFRAATEIDPDYPDPYFNLGVVLQNDGKWEEAVAAFRTSIGKNEQLKSPRTFSEAEILYGSHRIESAPVDLRAEKYDHQDAAAAYHWMGSIRHWQERYAEAIGLYGRAIEDFSVVGSGNLPRIHFDRGNAHVENGDRRAALADFRVACAGNHADACARKDTLADELGETE